MYLYISRYLYIEFPISTNEFLYKPATANFEHGSPWAPPWDPNGTPSPWAPWASVLKDRKDEKIKKFGPLVPTARADRPPPGRPPAATVRGQGELADHQRADLLPARQEVAEVLQPELGQQPQLQPQLRSVQCRRLTESFSISNK